MGEQMFVMKREVVGRRSLVSDGLVQSERRRFTVSELSCEFPQISRIVLYEIITIRLGCLRKIGSEKAHGCAQYAENDFIRL
jgi:hypothetical protein